MVERVTFEIFCIKVLHGLWVALTPSPQLHNTHHLKVTDVSMVTSNVFKVFGSCEPSQHGELPSIPSSTSQTQLFPP